MRYVISRLENDERELAYRIYVTDALYCQGNGKAMSKRYIEFLNPAPEDDRSGDEIAADVIANLNLKF